MTASLPSIAGLARAELAEKLVAVGVDASKAKMRAEQLWRWIYHYGVTDFAAMTNVAKELRATLAQYYTLARPEIVNEAIDLGGPSNVSQNDLAALLERRFKTAGKRRHVPLVAMRLSPLVKPFNELAARMMTLGLYSATEANAFPQWKAAADRFGVAPRTVETYVEQMT